MQRDKRKYLPGQHNVSMRVETLPSLQVNVIAFFVKVHKLMLNWGVVSVRLSVCVFRFRNFRTDLEFTWSVGDLQQSALIWINGNTQSA
jgi:hypothetical protein